jgi:hypothetical protein
MQGADPKEEGDEEEHEDQGSWPSIR